MIPAPRPPAFVFDPHACVGCHACAIACINEHQLPPGVFWRQIVTVNPARVPGMPTWHVSVACNHCLDAPCLRYCPARAIAREPTGAVVIDAGRCIGCRYCSWVCPYDAPRFDAGRGVMHKCTFCTHRLEAGLAPACTSLCPTGALTLGGLDAEGAATLTGFPASDIRPAIRFVSRRPLPPGPAGLQAAAADVGATGHVDVQAIAPAPAPKISLRSEWTLATFTFVAIVSVAWAVGALLGGPRVRVLPLLGLGGAAMALSGSHLGRPERAWRALLNWRHSWLSREVITWPAFLAAVTLWLMIRPGAPAAGWLAAAIGLGCLFCIDRVYAVMARVGRPVLDDGAALGAAVFLAGVLAGAPALAAAAGLHRLAAFLERGRALGALPSRDAGPLLDEGARGLSPASAAWQHPALRLGLGLVAPALIWALAPVSWAPAAAACAVAGEAIDRADLYASLDVETPRASAARALAAAL